MITPGNDRSGEMLLEELLESKEIFVDEKLIVDEELGKFMCLRAAALAHPLRWSPVLALVCSRDCLCLLPGERGGGECVEIEASIRKKAEDAEDDDEAEDDEALDGELAGILELV